MKKIISIGLFIVCFAWLSTPTLTQATRAKFKTITDDEIGTFDVTLHYKNVAAARKFKFELYDKRLGRTVYRKVLAFTKKRTSKTKKYFDLGLSNLKASRQYKIRYRPIYLGDRLGAWSDYRSWRTLKQAVYFTVDTSSAPAPDDTLYIVVDDSSNTSATPGTYALSTTDGVTYTAEIEGVEAGDILKYVIARKLNSVNTLEKFTPDDPTYLRSVSVNDVPTYTSISVDGWRWYDATFDATAGDVSTANWPISDRAQFDFSFALEPVYDDTLLAEAPTIFADMTTNGMTAVTLHYAPRMIINGDPIETDQDVPISPTESELTTLITQARAAGLEPILTIDFPIDPDNETTVEADLAGTHANSYLTNYLTRWREAMNDGVDLAIEQNITTVVLRTTFDDLEYTDDAQQAYISHVLLNDIIPVIGAGYSGILTTTDYNTDSDFTWYNASEIDWIGDTWYPTLADETSPTVAELYTTATSAIANTYSAVNATYGKPIYFHGLGVMSFDGAAAAGASVRATDSGIDPTDTDNDTYTKDYQEQADAYEALFRAIADTSYIAGISSIDFTYYIRQDKTANIHGKLAEMVWARWATLFADAL